MIYLTYLFDKLRRLRITTSTRLPHVATYTRELPINLARMYENAIDWEHLPILHSSSFSKLELIEQGQWGWKAKVYLQPSSFISSMVLELKLDRDKNRWITRTLSGLGKGTEIWTHAIPLAENKIKIIVDFYVPKLPKFLQAQYAKQYRETYAQLYDEDLWMMATRQQELNRVKEARAIIRNQTESSQISLGKISDVSNKLPLTFDFNRQSYRLVKLDNELIAHSVSCPHMLGPLEDSNIEEGILECPWHGYKFDIKTRKCISGQKCKLAPAPLIQIDPHSQEVSAHLTNKTTS